ncbi:hypothetical protein ZEAMMB73_Zm00001d033685 [Zea mays]|uniref:Uncharacterized protein n=1 Tax=Zea mays TaxID=4577 RepID=A0A1D6L1M2_MAIZE|nr:hypothetical protein ZEAMMB73_Zm00001d033685 [Zea mays]
MCPNCKVSIGTLPARLGHVNPRQFVPLGSTRGVIVVENERGEMHLLDLVTGVRKSLPSIAMFPLIICVEGLQVQHLGGHGDGTLPIDAFIQKAITVPTHDSGVMVLAIYC